MNEELPLPEPAFSGWDYGSLPAVQRDGYTADQMREYAKEALAQPEQELVELRTALAEALGDVYVCGRTWSAWGVGTMTQNDFYPAAESDEVLDSLVQAVATATPPPPKRPWVGLTDAERDECDWGQGERDYSLVIEAKLKEKNT